MIVLFWVVVDLVLTSKNVVAAKYRGFALAWEKHCSSVSNNCHNGYFIKYYSRRYQNRLNGHSQYFAKRLQHRLRSSHISSTLCYEWPYLRLLELAFLQLSGFIRFFQLKTKKKTLVELCLTIFPLIWSSKVQNWTKNFFFLELWSGNPLFLAFWHILDVQNFCKFKYLYFR